MAKKYRPGRAKRLFDEREWRKSVRSGGGNGGEGCVEVNLGMVAQGRVGVRDTKLKKRSPVFVFDLNEWGAFIGGAKDGEFDLPAEV